MDSVKILNILTRTHNKPEFFNVCKQSILSQTKIEYINWLVGSDTECPYYPAIKLFNDYRQPLSIPAGHYFAPWNLHLNTLQTYVREGWVMALDEDDKFTNEKSVMRILNAIQSEDELLIWKVKITPEWTVPSHSFGKYIAAGDISGIGMCWHSKYKPDWGNISYGDFRVATQIINMGCKPRWIDMVLTQTQAGPHNGR